MKKIKKPPNYKTGMTTQFSIEIDGKRYPVYQSVRAYAIGLWSRMFVKIKDEWFELNPHERGDVF